mmetsp:Transcript_66378/g.163544  ORF Transcript_66378/g.163544 Transcript_66378/m.163544 type:complete len:698 (-) Transcript_66378:582-2675(-)
MRAIVAIHNGTSHAVEHGHAVRPRERRNPAREVHVTRCGGARRDVRDARLGVGDEGDDVVAVEGPAREREGEVVPGGLLHKGHGVGRAEERDGVDVVLDRDHDGRFRVCARGVLDIGAGVAHLVAAGIERARVEAARRERRARQRQRQVGRQARTREHPLRREVARRRVGAERHGVGVGEDRGGLRELDLHRGALGHDGSSRDARGGQVVDLEAGHEGSDDGGDGAGRRGGQGPVVRDAVDGDDLVGADLHVDGEVVGQGLRRELDARVRGDDDDLLAIERGHAPCRGEGQLRVDAGAEPRARGEGCAARDLRGEGDPIVAAAGEARQEERDHALVDLRRVHLVVGREGEREIRAAAREGGGVGDLGEDREDRVDGDGLDRRVGVGRGVGGHGYGHDGAPRPAHTRDGVARGRRGRGGVLEVEGEAVGRPLPERRGAHDKGQLPAGREAKGGEIARCGARNVLLDGRGVVEDEARDGDDVVRDEGDVGHHRHRDDVGGAGRVDLVVDRRRLEGDHRLEAVEPVGYAQEIPKRQHAGVADRGRDRVVRPVERCKVEGDVDVEGLAVGGAVRDGKEDEVVRVGQHRLAALHRQDDLLRRRQQRRPEGRGGGAGVEDVGAVSELSEARESDGGRVRLEEVHVGRERHPQLIGVTSEGARLPNLGTDLWPHGEHGVRTVDHAQNGCRVDAYVPLGDGRGGV